MPIDPLWRVPDLEMDLLLPEVGGDLEIDTALAPVRTVEYYDVALGMYIIIIYLKPLYTVFTVRFKFFRHVD